MTEKEDQREKGRILRSFLSRITMNEGWKKRKEEKSPFIGMGQITQAVRLGWIGNQGSRLYRAIDGRDSRGILKSVTSTVRMEVPSWESVACGH